MQCFVSFVFFFSRCSISSPRVWWSRSCTCNKLSCSISSLRNVIERIFGIFKFKSAPSFPYTTQTEIVLAFVGLHNFLKKECKI
ncbi:unnamed protein product [Prunus armeniaca]